MGNNILLSNQVKINIINIVYNVSGNILYVVYDKLFKI